MNDLGKNSASRGKDDALKIEPLELEDIDTIATIFFASFTEAFIRRMFPQTPNTRRWWYGANLDAFSNDPTVRFMKVVDPVANSGKGKMIAWAKWVVPVHTITTAAGQDKLEDRWSGPPKETDQAAFEFFFGTLEKQRKTLMQNRPHYFLEMIGTLPEYQGRGAGSALLKWGCDQADHQGLEAYLDSSPGAMHVYQKFGFEAKTTVPMPDDSGENYAEIFMVRQPKDV